MHTYGSEYQIYKFGKNGIWVWNRNKIYMFYFKKNTFNKEWINIFNTLYKKFF